MTNIICVSSPIPCVPVRSLLTRLDFRPQNSRHIAALSFLYPLNTSYRRSLKQLGHMESTPEAQFLGFATQWRTKHRFISLALAIAPRVAAEGVTIYHAERLDEPSRLFFSVLRHYVPAHALRLVDGGPQKESLHSMAATYIEPEENRLIELLVQDTFTAAEQDELVRYGTACVLTANFWQGKSIYTKLIKVADLPFAHHCLAMAYSFLKDTERAQHCYEESVAKETDPILKMRGLYSLAILFLRYHPPHLLSTKRALSYLKKGYEVLNHPAAKLSREEYMYASLLFEGAKALLFFRRQAFSSALTITQRAVAQLETLPQSGMRTFCMAHGMSNIAQVYRAMGKLEKSAAVNKRIVEVDTRLPRWWEEYAKILLDLHRYDEAHQAIMRGLETHYDYASLHALLGLWGHKMGQNKQSVEAYQRACRYDPGNKVYHAAYNAAVKRAGGLQTKKAAFLA